MYERWPSAEEPRVFIIFGKERAGQWLIFRCTTSSWCGFTHTPCAAVPLGAETKRQEVLQTLWSLLCALVQLGTTIYLNWMAYRPMQKVHHTVQTCR